MHPVHKSGTAKRKEHQIRERKKIDEESKIPKLDTYFSRRLSGDVDGEFAAKSLPVSASDESSSASNHIASSAKTELTGPKTSQSKSVVDQESGTVFSNEQINENYAKVDQVAEVVDKDEVYINDNQDHAKHDIDTVVVAVGTQQKSLVKLEEQDLPNDIGLWSDSLSENMKTHWIAVGFRKIQHVDHDFKTSGVVHGKGYHRYCQTSFFTRVHPLTGERVNQSWLCYSPSNGKLYCGPCKLLSKTKSLFTCGFNDWKHGEEKISAHENSHQHRDCMVAVCTRKAIGGCVDKQLTDQFESERMY